MVSRAILNGWPLVPPSKVVSAPLFTVQPSLSGTFSVGSALTASPGTVTGFPTPTITYQWMRNGDDISGATSSSYTPTLADIGKRVDVAVRATNILGFVRVVLTGSIVVQSTGPSIGVSNITITGLNGADPNAPKFGDVFEIVDPPYVGDGLYYSWLASADGNPTNAALGVFTKRLRVLDSMAGKKLFAGVVAYKGATNSSIVYSTPSTSLISNAITVIESFDSTTGFTPSGAGSMTSDTVVKVQGTAGLRIKGTGVSGTNPFATKTLGSPVNPSALNVIMWSATSIEPGGVAGAGIQFVQTTPAVTSGLNNGKLSRSIGVGFAPGETNWYAMDASEESTLPATLTTTQIRARTTQSGGTSATNVTYDALLSAQRGGYAALVPYFDDNEDTTYTLAAPFFEANGARISVGFHEGGAYGVGLSDSMSYAQFDDLYQRGHDIVVNADPTDLIIADASTSVAQAVSKAVATRQILLDRGWTRGANHLIMPNGFIAGVSPGGAQPPVTFVTGTSDGVSPTVTFGASANVANGNKVYGGTLPDTGLTVQSGGGTGVTSCTLSSVITSGTRVLAFVDEDAVYYHGKLAAGFKAAGFQSARLTTGGALEGFRFGWGNKAFTLPGQGMTGFTLTNWQTLYAQMKLRGSMMFPYFHRLVDDSVTPVGINDYWSVFQNRWNPVFADKAAGITEIYTISQAYNLFGNASFPSTLY